MLENGISLRIYTMILTEIKRECFVSLFINCLAMSQRQ